MLKIHNVRFGHACNSSSSHSLILLNKPASDNLQEKSMGFATVNPDSFAEEYAIAELNNDEGFASCYEFGWNFFTATSKESKLAYLGVILRDMLKEQLPKSFVDAVTEKWVGFPTPDNAYIDHQSLIRLPCAYGTRLPDETFFEDFKAMFMQEHFAILGGNDNADYSHPLRDEGELIKLPLPEDSREYFVCRYDFRYNFWTLYAPATGNKIRMSFDNKGAVNPEKASVPELIDVKINSFCPFNCNFCTIGTTLIVTPNGLIQISDLAIGNKVYSWNEEKETRQEDVVDQIHQREYVGKMIEIELEDGSKIHLTPNHEVYTQRGWVIADHLLESDEVLKF